MDVAFGLAEVADDVGWPPPAPAEHADIKPAETATANTLISNLRTRPASSDCSILLPGRLSPGLLMRGGTRPARLPGGGPAGRSNQSHHGRM